MAKRRHEGEFELPFVALMDTMTNVVGVLIIVLVMIGISIASAVKKVLSDLPPVDEATYVQLQQQLAKSLAEKEAQDALIEKKKIEERLKLIVEELKTLDVTMSKQNIKLDNLSDIQSKIDAQKKVRDEQKAKMEQLLAEMEKLKARLDDTPIYVPPPATVVRMPNPRPFPEKANETRIMVAKQGVLFFNEKEYMQPILDGLEKMKSQLEYKEVKIDPFAKMLEGIFGGRPAAQQAWNEIAPLVSNFQMEQVALAYKTLATANLAPNKQMLQALGDVSIATRATLPAVAEAVVAATQGNYSKWIALDPSRDPAKPTITAAAAGGKVTFGWGAKKVEVKATPRDVVNYFTKELADMNGIKDKGRDRVIYDAFKIQAALQRAADNPTFSGSYTIQPTIRPTSTLVQVALVPRASGGETLAQMRAEGSNYQRRLRQIEGDPNGVAVFQVMSDAFETYLEARKIADDIGVAATWEFLPRLELAINVPGYEVQRFTPAPVAPPTPPGTAPAVRITAPPKTLD